MNKDDLKKALSLLNIETTDGRIKKSDMSKLEAFAEASVAVARGRKDIKETGQTLDILKAVEKTLNYGKKELDRLCKSKSDIMCDLTKKMAELVEQITVNKESTEEKLKKLKTDKNMLDSVSY